MMLMPMDVSLLPNGLGLTAPLAYHMCITCDMGGGPVSTTTPPPQNSLVASKEDSDHYISYNAGLSQKWRDSSAQATFRIY
jgi:hypothetical protein